MFLFEKCLTSNQPNGILVDQGFPHGWLHHQSGSLVTLRLLCLALVTWFLTNLRDKLVIEITDSLGFPKKGFFLQVCQAFCFFFLVRFVYIYAGNAGKLLCTFWMKVVCVCAFKGFLKAVSSTSTPLRVVNATFFDLADFYQFLGWPSNVFFFLWTLELIAFLAEVSMACLVYHGWDIGTQDR